MCLFLNLVYRGSCYMIRIYGQFPLKLTKLRNMFLSYNFQYF